MALAWPRAVRCAYDRAGCGQDDGTLGSATSVHAHAPSPKGPTPHTSGRQAAAHPHMVLPDPTGKFVFVPDLGTNSVVTYTLDSDASILTRSSELHLHPGAGYVLVWERTFVAVAWLWATSRERRPRARVTARATSLLLVRS